MAKASDQFRASDVSFWGVVALVACTVAVLGSTISALIPDDVLASLHASRLGGADLTQLRAELALLKGKSADLQQADTVLSQRFALAEQTAGAVTRRVGALELSVPRLLEAAAPASAPVVDTATVTGSTATPPPKTFAVDGGTVSVTETPLEPDADGGTASVQPMPQQLTDAAPDPAAFAVALGPPIDADEGVADWHGMNQKAGTLLLGLTPLLANVEGGPGRRLVAGPLGTQAGARDLCGSIARLGIACATMPFVGQPLSGD
ncbi:MAG TPA: hypothetical protein VHZ56_04770 [Devosia sp.]|nr:hypothetical protein [Devosia sp.]